MSNQSTFLIGQEPILTEFVQPNFAKYVQNRCKHNLLKGMKLKLLRKPNADEEPYRVLAP